MNQKPASPQMLPYSFDQLDTSPGNLLGPLRSGITAHLDLSSEREPVGGLGVFHCRAVQKLRKVPILQSFAVLVVAGKKRAIINDREVTVSAGELLAVFGFNLTGERNEQKTYSGIDDPGHGLFQCCAGRV